LLSKVLNNNTVSAHEFDIILPEFEKYNVLKEQVQAMLLHQLSNRKLVDAEKLEKEIPGFRLVVNETFPVQRTQFFAPHVESLAKNDI